MMQMGRATVALGAMVLSFLSLVLSLSSAACSNPSGELASSGSTVALEEISYSAEVFSDDLHLVLRLDDLGDAYDAGIAAWHDARYDEAESLLIEARTAAELNHSANSVQVACVDSSLGCLYLDMAHYEDASDNLVSSQVILRDAFGQDSPPVKAVLVSLAQHDYLTGDYETCRKDVRDILDSASPVEIWMCANRMQNLLYAADGEYVNAIRASRMMFQRFFESKGHEIAWEETEELAEYLSTKGLEDDLSTTDYKWLALTSMDVAGFYASIAGSEGAIDRADKWYACGIELCNKSLGSDKGDAMLGLLKAKQAYFEASVRLLEGSEALSLIDAAIEEQGGPVAGVNPALVESYLIYADTAGFLVGDKETALDYYGKAISLAEASFGHNHPLTARAIYRLGSFEGNRLRNDDAAISHFEEAIEIRKNILAENTIDTATLYLNLAGAYKLSGDETTSDEYLAKAREIYKSLDLHWLTTDEVNYRQAWDDLISSYTKALETNDVNLLLSCIGIDDNDASGLAHATAAIASSHGGSTTPELILEYYKSFYTRQLNDFHSAMNENYGPNWSLSHEIVFTEMLDESDVAQINSKLAEAGASNVNIRDVANLKAKFTVVSNGEEVDSNIVHQNDISGFLSQSMTVFHQDDYWYRGTDGWLGPPEDELASLLGI